MAVLVKCFINCPAVHAHYRSDGLCSFAVRLIIPLTIDDQLLSKQVLYLTY